MKRLKIPFRRAFQICRRVAGVIRESWRYLRDIAAAVREIARIIRRARQSGETDSRPVEGTALPKAPGQEEKEGEQEDEPGQEETGQQEENEGGQEEAGQQEEKEEENP